MLSYYSFYLSTCFTLAHALVLLLTVNTFYIILNVKKKKKKGKYEVKLVQDIIAVI